MGARSSASRAVGRLVPVRQQPVLSNGFPLPFAVQCHWRRSEHRQEMCFVGSTPGCHVECGANCELGCVQGWRRCGGTCTTTLCRRSSSRTTARCRMCDQKNFFVCFVHSTLQLAPSPQQHQHWTGTSHHSASKRMATAVDDDGGGGGGGCRRAVDGRRAAVAYAGVQVYSGRRRVLAVAAQSSPTGMRMGSSQKLISTANSPFRSCGLTCPDANSMPPGGASPHVMHTAKQDVDSRQRRPQAVRCPPSPPSPHHNAVTCARHTPMYTHRHRQGSGGESLACHSQVLG